MADNETKKALDALMLRRQAISGRAPGKPEPVVPPESKAITPKKKKSDQLSLWERLLHTLWGE